MQVVSFMEALEVTGPARNMIRFARAAPSASAKVSFATFRRSQREPVKAEATGFARTVSEAGLDLDVIPERFRFDPRAIAGMREVIARRNPDIVQTHSVKSHFLMSFLETASAPLWIAFHHGYTDPNFKMRLYNQLDRWSLRRPDLLVTVCSPFHDELVQKGVSPEKIRVLPNSIEGEPSWTHEEVEGLRAELNLTTDDNVVLSVGRLSREKAHRDLLLAVQLLKRSAEGRRLRVVLVGEGPERQRLQTLTDDLGLRDTVVFAGYRPRPGPFYQLADLFVLPSLSEGSPNVLLEAMAAGLPSVSTRVGGVADMIEDRVSGLLATAGDPQSLANAIAQVLDDPALANVLGSKAKQRIASDFTPGAYTDRLLGIYRAELAKRA